MQKRRSKYTVGQFKLKVGKSKTGKGLYAQENIPKGKCIIEYTGDVVPKEKWKTINSLYLFEVSKKLTINGNTKTNTAKYINHSCRPNCEIEIYKDRVYVFSKKNIKTGEELNYDYDTEYFNEYIKPKGCKCVKCSAK